MSLGAGLAGLVLLAACSSSGSPASTTTTGSATSGSATPGSTGSSSAGSITIGVARDVTGPFAAEYDGEWGGFNAAVAAQNAKGGINGKQIKLVTVDVGGTTTGDLTAVQSLVQNKGAFAVVELTGSASGGAQWLHDNGIPAVEPPVDDDTATYDNFFAGIHWR